MRTDFKYNVSDSYIASIRQTTRGNYTFDVSIPSYNRLYFYRDMVSSYTFKQSKKVGEILDRRTNTIVDVYSHGSNMDDNGGITAYNQDATFVYFDSKTKYYDWVLNWLYSTRMDREISKCDPPYDNFANSFCFDLLK